MVALRFDASGAEHGKEELTDVLEEDEARFEPRCGCPDSWHRVP